MMIVTFFTLETTAQKRRQARIGSANGGVWKTNVFNRNITDGTSNTIMRNKVAGGDVDGDGRAELNSSRRRRRNRTETVGINESITVSGARQRSANGIHAEKNQDIEIENDETHFVGRNRSQVSDNTSANGTWLFKNYRNAYSTKVGPDVTGNLRRPRQFTNTTFDDQAAFTNQAGATLTRKGTSQNMVQGNYIGTDRTGFYIDDIIIGATPKSQPRFRRR